MQSSADAASTRVLAADLAGWFDRAGVKSPDVAVDLADLLHAAKRLEDAVKSLLKLDLNDRAHVEQAIDELGRMHAWLFTEIKPHLADLEASWSGIEDPIVALVPDEPQ